MTGRWYLALLWGWLVLSVLSVLTMTYIWVCRTDEEGFLTWFGHTFHFFCLLPPYLICYYFITRWVDNMGERRSLEIAAVFD